jgi:hypothetical protein
MVRSRRPRAIGLLPDLSIEAIPPSIRRLFETFLQRADLSDFLEPDPFRLNRFRL